MIGHSMIRPNSVVAAVRRWRGLASEPTAADYRTLEQIREAAAELRRRGDSRLSERTAELRSRVSAGAAPVDPEVLLPAFGAVVEAFRRAGGG